MLLVVLGAAFTTWTSNANSGVQLEAPDHLRGRVVGLYFYAFNGAAPLGGLLVGWLSAMGGTELALAIGGLAALAMTAVCFVALRDEPAAAPSLSRSGPSPPRSPPDVLPNACTAPDRRQTERAFCERTATPLQEVPHMNVRLLILAVLAALIVGVSAAAAATIVGANGPDRLHGTVFADRIDGKAGDDAIYGHAGDDLLVGGLGDDAIWAGAAATASQAGPATTRSMHSPMTTSSTCSTAGPATTSPT